MASSTLNTTEEDIVILKAGWIYRQKPLFKRWKKSWMVVCLGGSLKCYKSKRSSFTQTKCNVKTDCMAIKFGKQCRHMLPPKDIDTQCMIEIFLTGGRTLKLCAHDVDSASLWTQAVVKAQAEKDLPTPRFSRKNRTNEDALVEESEKQNKRQKKWYAFLFCGEKKNKVKTFTTPRGKTSWT